MKLNFTFFLFFFVILFRFNSCVSWGCSSVGRAPALQAGGRQFDPDHLHQIRLRAGSSVGLERALDKREVGSSSLPRPTILKVSLIFIRSLFL